MFPDERFSICCIVPTLNAGPELKVFVNALSEQSYCFDLFFVDSSSDDGTENLVQQYSNDSAMSIKRSEFDHGGTRQMMVDRLTGYDIYVFLTQDAILAHDRAIEQLLYAFADPEVGCAYGRQLPHVGASLLAQHARFFNYPSVSHVYSLEDAISKGIKAAFVSNSFAAYRATALQEVGGFPTQLILSEDMYVGASMLVSGWKIAYSADATCFHSHDYTLLQEFSRYFDIGVFHSRTPWICKELGGVEGEGLRYVLSELKFLGFRHCYLWPSSLLRNALKLIGFKLGSIEAFIPMNVKKALSMHTRFWLS
ncbi:glycosyltransferase family 2 protein [Halomonas sp. ATCH28]|uniref:Glycosyltransferase family 2 protein n=1 Tax=Halomonas gemina TaxID=2945105 RepID=A0ABT0SX57_9GAMM|nr:glycosyltransferase [Halomonas gemina]MCL7939241.1 glycosyltransferase family 2 protein [Halomonas gemina]